MRIHFRRSAFALALLFALVLAGAACNRDPNYAKRQYVESGNKYFKRGRYKEALIMYRKALSKDPKYGEAYYRLALTFQATGQNASLVGVLRRATELLKPGTPEWNDAALKLGEILVQGAIMQDVPGRDKPLWDEVNQLQTKLDARAPGSFEDVRLKGEIARGEAALDLRRKDTDAAKRDLQESVDDLRQSLQAKPADNNSTIALGRELIVLGKTAEAETIYRSLTDRDKTYALGYVELYRTLMVQKRFPEAEAVLKRAIANNPKDFSFRTMLAGYYFSQGNRASMVQVLNDMKANGKDFPDAYLTAGDFYSRIRDFDAASQQFQEGEGKNPKRKAEYQKREIEVLLRQNKKDQAYAKTLEILKENPKDPDARSLQADFMIERGDANAAISELQEVVTAKPDNFVARFNLGRAFAAKGDYAQAIQQFSQSIQARPDYLRPRLALAEADLHVGDFNGALKTAEETAKMSSNNAGPLLLEAIALMRLNRDDDSRKILTDLVSHYPQFSDADLELAALDAREKNYGPARELFQKAYELNPKDLRSLVGEAETWFAMNQPDKALAILQAEVAKHPERSDLLQEYASLKTRAAQYDGAMADYKTLLDRFKGKAAETATVEFAIGQLEARRGNAQASVDALRKARALQPTNQAVLTFLAEEEMRVGQKKDAQETYRAALAQNPNSALALNNLAYSIAESGTNLDEALTYATKAKQLMPNVLQVDDTLGWVYVKKGMNDQAAEIFKRLTATQPDNATFHYHYCLALSGNGDKADAQKECNLALAKNPAKDDAEGARQTLAKLR